MNNLVRLYSFAGVLMACTAFGQESETTGRPVARQTPILATRAEPAKPFPGGTYVGHVTGEVRARSTGIEDTYNLGDWSIGPLEIGDCLDECDPGQYWFRGSFKSTIYESGYQDEGSVFGYLNPSGRVMQFQMITTSCKSIPLPNPDNSIPGFDGGMWGPVDGTVVTIDDGGELSGSISGYDCFGNRISVKRLRLFRTSR